MTPASLGLELAGTSGRAGEDSPACHNWCRYYGRNTHHRDTETQSKIGIVDFGIGIGASANLFES
jgi:hypothetical protein